jgi:hypothetical protein
MTIERAILYKNILSAEGAASIACTVSFNQWRLFSRTKKACDIAGFSMSATGFERIVFAEPVTKWRPNKERLA